MSRPRHDTCPKGRADPRPMPWRLCRARSGLGTTHSPAVPFRSKLVLLPHVDLTCHSPKRPPISICSHKDLSESFKFDWY